MGKKLMIGFIVLAIAIAVFGAVGSGAWFSDTASSNDNLLTAARLELQVNGNDTATRQYVLENIKPGDWALAGQQKLKNTGSIPGMLWFEIVNVTPADGPLGALVYPKPQLNMAPWTRYGGTQVLNQSVGVHTDVMVLDPGQEIPIVFYFSWPSTANDNAAQGASLTYDVIWHLDQVH